MASPVPPPSNDSLWAKACELIKENSFAGVCLRLQPEVCKKAEHQKDAVCKEIFDKCIIEQIWVYHAIR